MKSEALRRIGTMRQVKTSLDAARCQRPKTTNSLSKTVNEVKYLESLTDHRLQPILEKERKRFKAQDAAISKSRQRVLRAREKLAMTVNKNRSLAELRRKLQQTRWEEDAPVAPGTPLPTPGLRQMELKY